MATKWLMLLHRLPSEPAYARVKVGRQMGQIGAVGLKNAVYVLPDREACRESFEWARGEITAQGGEATLLRSEVVEGLSDRAVEALFRSARDADYLDLAEQARTLKKIVARERSGALGAELGRLEKRLTEIKALDFFDAPKRSAAEGIISALRHNVAGLVEIGLAPIGDPHAYRGRIWVTRRNVQVDRLASAWLIRRFIDRKARFRFVAADHQLKARDGIGFDMFGTEFSHHGDRCTFEVLRQRFALEKRGLVELGEIVHDLDLKDGKFGRSECAGVAAMLRGVTLRSGDDHTRCERALELFDAMQASLATPSRKGES